MHVLFRTQIIILLLIPFSSATSWHIDNSVNVSGNGTSWQAPWKSFNDIVWENISAGDVIFLSGGEEFKVYNETLVVGASGSSLEHIIITGSGDEGHNGEVIIDGGGFRSNGVFIEEIKFVTIANMTIRNHTNPEIRIKGEGGYVYDKETASSFVTIDGVNLFIVGRAGVHIETSDHIVVKNSHFNTAVWSEAQTDGIYSQRNYENVYEKNVIIISNDYFDGHNDGIQMYQDTNITVRYNYVEQNNTKESNAQGIFAESSTGIMRMYGNIVYGPSTKNALLKNDRSNNLSSLYAYSNTLYGGGWGSIFIEDSPESKVKNNIMFVNKEDYYVMRIRGEMPLAEDVNYNLYYVINNGSKFSNAGINFSQWQELGYDANSSFSDPLFINSSARNFRIKEDSFAIDSGIDLGQEFFLSNDGVQRPVGLGWDIGAHELNYENMTNSSDSFNETNYTREDFNEDLEIDIADFLLLNSHYGLVNSTESFNETFEFNEDDEVALFELSWFGRMFFS